MTNGRRKRNYVVAIIQARMASLRLPGKMMLDINGQPLIFHIIQRTKFLKNIDKYLIATSTNRKDDQIVNWAKQNGISYYRGSETNLLERFTQATYITRADIIVRINGDSPLFDTSFVDKMIKLIIQKKSDYITLENNGSSVHGGVNVFSNSALKTANELAKTSYEKEHIIPFMIDNPKLFKYSYITQSKIFKKNDLRLSIDTIADLTLIRQIYKNLYKSEEIISLADVIKYLEKNSDIKKINAHVQSIDKEKRPGFKIIVTLAAKPNIGYGHLFRMAILAKTLTENFANSVKFLVDGDEFAKKYICGKGFEYLNYNNNSIETFYKHKPDALIIDSHEKDLSYFFSKIDSKIYKISYDDGKSSKYANLQFKPTFFEKNDTYSGFKYLILKKSINASKRKREFILISAGASDDNNYILRIASKLKVPENLQLALLIGPNYNYRKKLSSFVKKNPQITVFDTGELGEVFAQVKIAICYFGVTMFEMMASNVVCAVFAMNLDHKRQIKRFSTKGYIYDLGYFIESRIFLKIEQFIRNEEQVNNIFENIRGKIDSDGDLRVAKIIQRRLLDLKN